jgi:hypothetical protein
MGDIAWFVIGWIAADIAKSVAVFLRRERNRSEFTRHRTSRYAVVRWWHSYLA